MSTSPWNVFEAPLDGATLVEASAGTGKTWAISALVLRLVVERGLEVARVLVVTFTVAATDELRERIRQRLAETLARLRAPAGTPLPRDPFVDGVLEAAQRAGVDTATIERRLALALQTFDEAAIFTVHGFCQRALADSPFSSGLPLALQLQEDTAPLHEAAARDAWREAARTLPAALSLRLLQRGDGPLRVAVWLRQLRAKPLARVLWPDHAVDDPAEWARLRGEADAAFAAARDAWTAGRDEVLAVVAEAAPRMRKGSFTPEKLAAAAAAWDAWCTLDDALSQPDNADELSRLSSLKVRANKGEAPPGEHPFLALATAALQAREAALAPLDAARLRWLLGVLADAGRRLDAAQRAARVLGFDDLLRLLHERLQGPGGAAQAAALRARYGAALVDEFQDTDPLQWAVFERLFMPEAGPAPTLFLVGDPKQAIYAFRNADLPTYLRARQRVARQATLVQNQRSVRPLIDALNALFTQRPDPFGLPGLHYPPVTVGAKPRPPFADPDGDPAALQLLALPDGSDAAPGDVPRAGAALALAARACAAEIARLLARGAAGRATLDGRPLAAGDVAVLVRTHRQGAAVREALQALGVGCVERSQRSVLASREAEELARLLQALADPAREGAVRAALATELLGWSAAQLAALDDDDAPLAAEVQRLHVWRLRWQQRGVASALRRAFDEAGSTARLLARPDGERRLTNLRHLVEWLHAAAAPGGAPQTLVRALQQARDEALRGTRSEATQLRLESDRDLVQIVTVHVSKGLEYPVVFLPFAWEGGGPRAGGEQRPEWRDEASGQTLIDHRELDGDSAEIRLLKARRDADARAEALRLAYVALTRAVHRVVAVVGPTVLRDSVQAAWQAPLQHLVGLTLPASVPGVKKPTVEQLSAVIGQAWRDFAAAHAGCVSWRPLPAADAAPLIPATPPPDGVQAQPLPGPLPAPWTVGSYSSLLRGAQAEALVRDHDLLAGDDTDAAASPSRADDDILDFARGAAAGEALHAVLERVDFGAPAGWPEVVEATLREHALPGAAAVRRMLHDVLSAELPPPVPGAEPVVLARVPAGRRIAELEFMLPVRRLAAAPLRALLRAHGVAVPRLDFAPLQGLLRGFVDLVFESGGRFHVLDWKSNHLGTRPADYAAAPLAAAMDREGYRLQALLYALALHRWLGRRLRGYAYDTHFGGVYYLFVRGLRGGDPAWRDAAGWPTGVHLERPPLALLDALSAVLEDRSHEVSA